MSSAGSLAIVGLACVFLILQGGCTPPGATTSGKTAGLDILPGNGGGEQLPTNTGKPLSKEDAEVLKAVDKGVAYLQKRLLEPDGKLLYSFQHNEDPHVGAAALAGMTLIECDVSPADPAVVKAIQLVKDRNRQLTFTYSLALSILFLDRLIENKAVAKADKETYKEIIRHLGLQLIGNQHILGGWNYYTQLLTPQEETDLLSKLQAGTFKAGGYKPPPDDNVYRDNSISQFVILALWSARKYNINVEKTLLMEEEIFRDDQNPKDGSWDYSRTNATARDATTCAGLICLAIGHAVKDEIAEKAVGKTPGKKDEKKKVDLTKDPSIKKALEFISRPFGKNTFVPLNEVAKRQNLTNELEELHRQYLQKSLASPLKELKIASDQAKLAYYQEKSANPASPKLGELKGRMEEAGDALNKEEKRVELVDIKIAIKEKDNKDLAKGILIGTDAWGDLYFLWSVERVAVIYGLEKINGRDWYSFGKKLILKNQKEDGSWKERFPGVPDTCFALLFLKRVNIVKDLTDKLQRLLAALTSNPSPGPPLPPKKHEA